MKISTRYWFIFFGGLIAVGIAGVFLLASDIGGGNFDFIFEKMVWFPINMIFLTLIFNRLTTQIDSAKERRRARNLTRRPSKDLIENLKVNTVNIVFDSSDNQFEDYTEEEVFNELVDNLDKYVTKDLVEVKRKYYVVDKGEEETFEIEDILSLFCTRINQELYDYLDNFHQYMEDDLYDEMMDLKEKNYYLGRVYYSELYVLTDQEYYEEKSELSDKDELIDQIKELIQAIDSFINTLRDNYKKKLTVD